MSTTARCSHCSALIAFCECPADAIRAARQDAPPAAAPLGEAPLTADERDRFAIAAAAEESLFPARALLRYEATLVAVEQQLAAARAEVSRLTADAERLEQLTPKMALQIMGEKDRIISLRNRDIARLEAVLAEIETDARIGSEVATSLLQARQRCSWILGRVRAARAATTEST